MHVGGGLFYISSAMTISLTRSMLPTMRLPFLAVGSQNKSVGFIAFKKLYIKYIILLACIFIVVDYFDDQICRSIRCKDVIV